jgi:hypothetical protein
MPFSNKENGISQVIFLSTLMDFYKKLTFVSSNDNFKLIQLI